MSYQITVLAELFLVSICMFTFPFVSYFGTQHGIKEYYPSLIDSGWDFFLPIVTAAFTVWNIISAYIYIAFPDPNTYTDVDKED